MEECPKSYLTISQNKDEMQDFCFPPKDHDILPFRRRMDDWTDLTANELVQKEICPAWVIPSDPFLGRCLPSPSIINSGSDTNRSSKCFCTYVIYKK